MTSQVVVVERGGSRKIEVVDSANGRLWRRRQGAAETTGLKRKYASENKVVDADGEATCAAAAGFVEWRVSSV